MSNRKCRLFLICLEVYNNNRIAVYNWLGIAAEINNSNNNKNYNRDVTIGIIAAP